MSDDISFNAEDPLEADFANLTVEEDATPKRRTRKPRADKGQPRRSSNKKLADELLNPWAKVASGIAFGAPTLAGVMLHRGEQTMDALVSIAGEHPRMLEALRQVGKIGPATELAETGIHMMIALLLDVGRIPPEHPIATLTGVSEVYRQMHPEVPQQNDVALNGQGFATAPPPFMSGVAA